MSAYTPLTLAAKKQLGDQIAWVYRILLVGLLFTFSSYSFAACNEQDVPLGSGIVSTGTSISRLVENQFSSAVGDGQFIYEFNSNNNPAQCGRHADGTWWIAPASGQNNVTLTGIRSNRPRIRAEDNPDPAARGFLNNAENYGRHNSSNNIIPALPIDYPLNNDAITSIFSVIQRDTGRNCGTGAIREECVEFADFVTIYDTEPNEGGKNTIRPTMFGTTKQVYTWSDFDRTRIPKFSEAQSVYDQTEVLELIEKWTATTESFSISVCEQGYLNCNFISEGGRAFRSHGVIADYAADGGQNDVLSYLLNTSSDVINNTEDAALLAAIIAYGIDLITLIGDPPSTEVYTFSSGAGQFMNAANFSYFTAALTARNSFAWRTMHETVRAMVDSPTISGPQELQQIYDAGSGPLWGDGRPANIDLDLRRHWAEMLSGMTHDNTDNWIEFTIQTAGRTFQIKDDETNLVPPSRCDVQLNFEDANSVCQNSTVIVNNEFRDRFNYDMIGTNIIFNEALSVGDKVRISPIITFREGTLGGNRAAGDPHGYVDGPPGVPGTGYFEVSNRSRIVWAGIAQSFPELCEVVNYPPLYEFVERLVTSGLKTDNDPCAPPSPVDLTGVCNPFNAINCIDFGRSNNGTVRWGPDPRDESQCVHNNTVLTEQADGSWLESFENRGDNGRYSNMAGRKHNQIPSRLSEQYLAFRGDRSCRSSEPVDLSNQETIFMIPLKNGKNAIIAL